MERSVDWKYFVLFILFLLILKVCSQDPNQRSHNSVNSQRACAYVQCENSDTCVHRKFRCRDSSCPSMLYCAKSRTELLRGPSTCDTVRCSSGYLCMQKVRGCRWDEKCKQQIARCVSRKEYYEGPASCAGFKCAQGSQCILRESFCKTPPCKLLRSCSKHKDVRVWFNKCRSLGCPSEFECFLRRPEHICSDPPCKHTPDCIAMTEGEVINEHCRGWICPRTETCFAEIIGSCEADNCNVNRTCQKDHTVITNNTSSLSRRSPNNDEHTVSTETVTKISSNVTQTIEETTAINEAIPINKTCLFGCGMENKASQLWLDGSSSNAELNAIQFRWKNIHEPKNFKNTSPYEDRYAQEIDSIPGEKNFTNTVDELPLNKILLPPYTTLEAILLNSLAESNNIPFLDFVLRCFLQKRDQSLLSDLLKIKDNRKYSHYVPPAENTEGPGNFHGINYNPSIYHGSEQYDVLPENEVSEVQAILKDISEILQNSSSTEIDEPSLWTESNENLGSEALYRKMNFIEHYDDAFENEALSYKMNNHDDESNLLRKLINALLLTSAENTNRNFNKNEENRQDEKDLWTPELIYGDEDSTFRSFYNILNNEEKNQIEKNHSEFEENMEREFPFYYKK